MNSNVIIIGDSGDMKLQESHPREYNKVEIIRLEEAQNDKRYIGAEPQRGAVFVKHPFMNCFVANNEDLDYNICSAMVGDIRLFAQELGARFICFSITIKSKKLFSNKIEIKVSAGKNEGKANSKFEKEIDAFASLSAGSNFDRDVDYLSEEEFEIAKQHFEQSNLFKHCDPLKTAESMLKGRDPNAKTKIRDTNLVIDKTINLNEELSIAFSYKKAAILKANGAYTQNKKFSKHIHIEMFYDFHRNYDQCPDGVFGES